jgi:hypothetical protein
MMQQSKNENFILVNFYFFYRDDEGNVCSSIIQWCDCHCETTSGEFHLIYSIVLYFTLDVLIKSNDVRAWEVKVVTC